MMSQSLRGRKIIACAVPYTSKSLSLAPMAAQWYQLQQSEFL
jgi:hypothetical protein